MTLIRRIILALALMAGIAPAIAQVPPPIPALPDTERRTSYSIVASQCTCNVNFALYGDSTDYQNWVEVYVNDVRVSFNDVVNGWRITSPTGSLATIPRPVTDAVLTFNTAQSGTVQIVGARRPRRISQFNEGAGVPTRNFNQVLTDLTAQNREFWDKTNDMTGRGLFFPPGYTTGPMPSPTNCRSQYLGFDATGLNPTCSPIIPPTPVACTTSDCGAGFGGRLTLISGKPVMDADVVGAQTVFYAPDKGTTAPVLVSGTFQQLAFTTNATDQIGLSLVLGGSANFPRGTIFDAFIIKNAGFPVLASRAWDSAMLPTTIQIANVTTITTRTGANPWVRSTAAFDGTVSKLKAASAVNAPSNSSNNCLGQDWGIGNPNVISKVVITAPTDDFLRGDATTSLTTRIYGSNDNTNWQILAQPNLNASVAGQSYTIPINVNYVTPYRYNMACIAGNGASSINVAQIQFYTTAASSTRRLTRYNGILVNDAPITGRIDASNTVAVAQYEASYVGSFQTDAGTDGSVSAHVNYGPSRAYGVWNLYNQKNITLRACTIYLSSSDVFSYTLASPANVSWGPMEGNTNYSMSVLIGYAQEPLTAILPRVLYLNATSASALNTSYEAGIGVDTTAGFSGSEISNTIDTSPGPALGINGTASLTLPPFFGSHTLYGVEKLGGPTTGGTVSLFTDMRNSCLTASWRG